MYAPELEERIHVHNVKKKIEETRASRLKRQASRKDL